MTPTKVIISRTQWPTPWQNKPWGWERGAAVMKTGESDGEAVAHLNQITRTLDEHVSLGLIHLHKTITLGVPASASLRRWALGCWQLHHDCSAAYKLAADSIHGALRNYKACKFS